MRSIIPLYGNAAVFVPPCKALIIADLHIGLEYELYERGIHIESRTDDLIEKIEKLLRGKNVEQLFILGDLKHVIPSSPPSQKRDIKRFFERLNELVNISIVPGNHDGGLKKILPSADIKDSGGYVLNVEPDVELDVELDVESTSIGLIHGHRWPSEEVMQCSTIITAHTHPTVSLKDSFGYEFFERCWVISKLDVDKVKRRYSLLRHSDFVNAEVIVMPAFNPICGGLPVNKEGIAGPISKMIDLEESDVYLLDGTALGKIKNLK